MERRKLIRKFKREAVRPIKDRGVSYVQASQDLGVHTSQLLCLEWSWPDPMANPIPPAKLQSRSLVTALLGDSCERLRYYTTTPGAAHQSKAHRGSGHRQQLGYALHLSRSRLRND
jgi:hypothetical protein